jgi:hypothetical protein
MALSYLLNIEVCTCVLNDKFSAKVTLSFPKSQAALTRLAEVSSKTNTSIEELQKWAESVRDRRAYDLRVELQAQAYS